MGKRMTQEEHRRLREQVYAASLQGVSASMIAINIGKSQRTVERLLAEARENSLKNLSEFDEEKHRNQFLAEQDQIMAVAWQRLRAMQDKSLNVSNLLSVIGSASERKAKALGLMKTQITGDKNNPIQVEFDWSRGIQEALSNREQNAIGVDEAPALPKPQEDILDAEFSSNDVEHAHLQGKE